LVTRLTKNNTKTNAGKGTTPHGRKLLKHHSKED